MACRGVPSEHRSVLEWLNESGPKDAKFFAIRPRLVSIPSCEERGFEFEVVVEPNEWDRELAGGGSLSETEQSYRDFFDLLIDAYSERRPHWRELTAGTRGYLTFGAGKSGLSFGWVFHQGPEFSVELYISTSAKATNETIFERLRDDRDEIEDALDTELTWQQLPEKQACRIKWPKKIPGRITELSDEEQADLIEWGVDAMDAFQAEIEPRVNSLEVDEE